MKSYTERKEAWAAKMKEKGAKADAIRSTDRLPPGQHTVAHFPVLDLGVRPAVPLTEWQLDICGAVETPVSWTWEQFQDLPTIELTQDFHCVTTWSQYDLRFRGVPLSYVLDLVKPLPSAHFIFYTSYDGYTTNTGIDPLLHEGAMLASTVADQPLSVEHGGPVRVIIPHLYAWKGAKWVRRIEFLEKEQLGYWEKRGYSNTADPWTNDRFA
jgi:DMSO/TMAO reductase YedYZ molybdopterin-dependent catalytic subunit